MYIVTYKYGTANGKVRTQSLWTNAKSEQDATEIVSKQLLNEKLPWYKIIQVKKL